MSSSAEYGGQIVAVVTKLIGGVEFLAPNQNPSFIHTVEARSERVGARVTAQHSKNAPTKAEKDFEMTKHAKLLLKHDESSIVRFARKQIEGKMTGLETRDFYDAIVKCADARRAPGESDAQAFTKTIIEDETFSRHCNSRRAAPRKPRRRKRQVGRTEDHGVDSQRPAHPEPRLQRPCHVVGGLPFSDFSRNHRWRTVS
jgi:hypothetical protein